MEVNRKNILGWLSLILVVYPMDKSTRKKLEDYLSYKNKRKREKMVEDIYGGDYG